MLRTSKRVRQHLGRRHRIKITYLSYVYQAIRRHQIIDNKRNYFILLRSMEVTTYRIDPECYPRYKHATIRISDIIGRADKLSSETFGPSYQTGKDIELHKNVKIQICDRKGSEKLDLNCENLVLRENGIQKQETQTFSDTESFLTENRDAFNTSSVLIFREHNDLHHELRNFPPGPSLLIVTNKPNKTNKQKEFTMVSSREETAKEISLLLEQKAFRPMKEKFDFIKSLFNEKKRDGNDQCTKTSNRCENKINFDETGGNKKSKMKGSKASEQKSNGTVECIFPGGSVGQMYGNANMSTKSEHSTSNYLRNRRKFDEMNEKVNSKAKVLKETASAVVGKNIINKKTERCNRISSGDSLRKMNGYTEISTRFEYSTSNHCGNKEKFDAMNGNLNLKPTAKRSDASQEHKGARARKRRCCTLQVENSTSGLQQSDDVSKNKFVENKPKFQRVLGEMIGMYRRSNIPAYLKPDLDGPLEGNVSDQIMKKVYHISPSIKGYSYKYITRLQIHVLADDIEMLKPKIAKELCKHGYETDAYDVIPPVDEVVTCTKTLVGSKVENESMYGSLGAFVEMKSKENGRPVYCALTSKHLLDGRKTVKISNKQQTLIADVIERTAAGDSHMVFDIAAAKIKKDDEKHCDGRFKKEDGTLMKGKMFDNDARLLECQYVHMSGASTSKGLGIITTTCCSNREPAETENCRTQTRQSKPNAGNERFDEDKKFIYIDSRDKTIPFCQGGDSGAMVCADDEDGKHVNLISTVIGLNSEGLSQTLRLKSGVSYLEGITESSISFLEK